MRMRLSLPAKYDWLESLSGRARTRLFVRLLDEKSKDELLSLALGESVQVQEREPEEEEPEVEQEVQEVQEVNPSILQNFM